MGTAPKPKSTRARKARSVKATGPAARKGAASPPPPTIPDRHRSLLRDMRYQLSLAAGVAGICGAVLREQAAGYDGDAGLVIQRYIADVVQVQVERLERLVGGGAP